MAQLIFITSFFRYSFYASVVLSQCLTGGGFYLGSDLNLHSWRIWVLLVLPLLGFAFFGGFPLNFSIGDKKQRYPMDSPWIPDRVLFAFIVNWTYHFIQYCNLASDYWFSGMRPQNSQVAVSISHSFGSLLCTLMKVYFPWDCSRWGRCLSPYPVSPPEFICSCNAEFPEQWQLSPFSCLFLWAFSGTLPKGSIAQECGKVNVLWVGVVGYIPCFLVLQKDNSEACSTLFFRGFLVRLSFSCLQCSSTHCHTFIVFFPFSGSLSSLPHLCLLGSLAKQTVSAQDLS